MKVVATCTGRAGTGGWEHTCRCSWGASRAPPSSSSRDPSASGAPHKMLCGAACKHQVARTRDRETGRHAEGSEGSKGAHAEMKKPV